MRIIAEQRPLFLPVVNHPFADLLKSISLVLGELGGEVSMLVHRDLCAGVANPNLGRIGMSASQVLRACVLQRMHTWTYEEFGWHLVDSATSRAFCGIFGDGAPSAATLNSNINKLSVETLDEINALIVKAADAAGVEDLSSIRTDCFVVESNIHSPTDSELLWDCARVLYRELVRARDLVGTRFRNAAKFAKKLWWRVTNARGKERKRPHYKKLIKVVRKATWVAKRAIKDLERSSLPESVVVQARLGHYSELAGQVLSQANRRVILGESVPATEKVLSIFEPHTDIIIKGNFKIEYGHKVCVTAGSGLVTDSWLLKGNPADSTLTIEAVERHIKRYGKVPTEFAADGGFTSRKNLQVLKEELEVEEVAFSKRRGLAIEDMSSSIDTYKRLYNFRAGVEAVISFLKRGVALRRCPMKGWDGFSRYVAACTLAGNLLTLGRRLLAAEAAAG